jgi:hypothetical protein
VRGSAGVMAAVLAQTVAGSTALLFLTPLWREVKRGFFTLSGVVVAVLAVPAWWSAHVGRIAGSEAGLWAERLTALTAVLAVVWAVSMLATRHRLARTAGLLAIPASLLALVALAGTARQGSGVALFQLLAGAAFLGAVLDGLLLGHWYLTDRGLSRGPINRSTTILVGAVALEAVAVVTAGFGGVGSSDEFNPLLTAGALAPWIALGMVGTTALIAVMVRLTLRGDRSSAVQSATGFFYLAVVTAFTAEVAVKVRFLAG